MPKTASYPGDVPKLRGDSLEQRLDACRVVTVPQGWMPHISIHAFTDFVLNDMPVKLRLVYFNAGGAIVGGGTYSFHRDAPLHIGDRDVPIGTEAIMFQREPGPGHSNLAPAGFRVDMWD